MFKKYLLSSAAVFAPPGEGTEVDQEIEQNEQDESLQEGQEPDETLEGQDARDGEGEDEDPDAEGDEGQVDSEPRRPNRAQSRIQALAQSTREAKERADKFERELTELRAAQQQRERQSQQESPEARAARRALMDPTEVLREDLRESEERTRQMLHQSALQQQETNDKLAYTAVLRDNPGFKKFDADVEKIRLEQKANGAFVPREVILDLVIGRAARAAAAKKAPKAREEGRRRVEAQQSRPAAARGDTSTARGRQGDTLEKRLENIPL